MPLNHPQDRIVGGVNAIKQQIPYQVSIRFKGRHRCGGTIIGPSDIISAAHCFNHPYSTSLYSIRAGALKLSGNESTIQDRSVAQILNHPEYINDVNYLWANDIAIVKLSSPLIFNFDVKAILLAPEGMNFRNSMGTISGWGLTKEGGNRPPEDLQTANIQVVDSDICKQLYGWRFRDSMICAGPYGQKATCQGDSGGPLMVETGAKFLVGITSSANGCARRG